MIVYGDPQFEVPARSFLREQQSRAETLAAKVDELRAFLIRASLLEQAASDAFPDANPENARIIEHIRRKPNE